MDIDTRAPVITRDEIGIAAPSSRVWDLLTNISEWPKWNKDIQSASLSTPLAVGAVFTWSTAGLNIASTVGELVPQKRIAWSGAVQGIVGIHVWQFTSTEGGVLVHTEESWSGEPVIPQTDAIQRALDLSIRSWLES